MKEIKIKDNLIVCAETEKEKFGLIGLYPPITFFIKKDWVNKITISDHWTWSVLSGWSKYNGKDKSSQVNVIKLRCSKIDKIFGLEYNISLRLDRKDLGRLRKDPLSIPEYKVIWVDIGVTNGFKHYKRYSRPYL